MSVASELSRIQQAKSDLATSIANKGVTVPAATTIDGYAALVDQIQQGGVSRYDAVIEYLESSSNGGEYINTGVKGSNTVSIRLKCIYKKNSSNENLGFIFGSRTATLNKDLSVIHSYSGQFRYGNSLTQNTFIVSKDTWVLFDNTAAHNSMQIYDQAGNLLGTLSATANTFSNNLNIYLFTINNNGAVGNSCKSLKIYGCKMYNGSTMVRDYIPVRVGTVGYLYDKVSQTLFGNQGTGSFALGPDVT